MLLNTKDLQFTGFTLLRQQLCVSTPLLRYSFYYFVSSDLFLIKGKISSSTTVVQPKRKKALSLD